MERLIENKLKLIEFCFFYLEKLLFKFINSIILKPNTVLVNLKFSFFYYVFIFLKYSFILKIVMLLDIIAIDHPDKILKGTKFELVYVLVSTVLNFRFFFKIFFNIENLVISLSSLYASANWFEREVWDLYGIKFLFHKDLRRILTDYGFVGHPLLKEFPLTGFIELRYDDSVGSIIYEPIEISQALRIFKYENPWFMWKA